MSSFTEIFRTWGLYFDAENETDLQMFSMAPVPDAVQKIASALSPELILEMNNERAVGDDNYSDFCKEIAKEAALRGIDLNKRIQFAEAFGSASNAPDTCH